MELVYIIMDLLQHFQHGTLLQFNSGSQHSIDNRALLRREIISKEDASSEFMLEEQLQIINEYLRSQYLYCLWCGITFSDNEDFSSNCPGSTRDDHE